MKRLFLLAAFLGAAAGLPGTAAAFCQNVTFEGRGHTVCTVDPAIDTIELWLRNADGKIYGSFAAVDQALAAQGQRLGFAMNGGMYHPDRAPVGLYIEDGMEQAPLVERARGGNFGLLPNGVFCVGDGAARVIETDRFAEDRPACRFATQSGPMLVIDGALHPRFLVDATSRYVRNGVGVDPSGRVHFAISDRPVTFHEFGRFFRDHLGTPNALYLDGAVSRLYAPALGRFGIGRPLGPIVGVVVPAG